MKHKELPNIRINFNNELRILKALIYRYNQNGHYPITPEQIPTRINLKDIKTELRFFDSVNLVNIVDKEQYLLYPNQKLLNINLEQNKRFLLKKCIYNSWFSILVKDIIKFSKNVKKNLIVKKLAVKSENDLCRNKRKLERLIDWLKHSKLIIEDKGYILNFSNEGINQKSILKFC